MEQLEALEIIRQSENFSKQLAQIESEVFTWADNKEKLYKNFFKQMSRYKKILEAFPEEWLQASSNQFVAGKVFGNPGRLRKYLHNQRDFLDREGENLLHHFLDNSWFYSLFEITDIFPNNILKAQDCSKGDEFYLYSEGTANLYKQGKNLFMSLLFDNGKCCQTYGIIHYYQGYSIQDFISFARLVSYHYRNSHDLSESIRQNAVEYMLLDRFAEIPVTKHKNETIVFCAHSRRVESFDPSDYKSEFFIEEKSDVIKCSFKKYQGTMSFTSIYYDKKKKNLLLYSVGLSRYRELAGLLKNKYGFPPDPSWYFSPQMMAAVDAILGIQDPSLVYEKHFNEENEVHHSQLQSELNEVEHDKEALEPLNSLVQEITECKNTGKDYSLSELALKYNVPIETARQIESMFQEMDNKFNIDLEGGFQNFKPPPPSERLKFRDSLKLNKLFKLAADADVEEYISTLNLGIETIKDFLNLLDDLYHRIWEKRDYTILLYTLYLLSIKGRAFEPVKNYACEYLKTFWQTILLVNSEIAINSFIIKYKKFCISVLNKTGLVTIDEEPGEQKLHKIDFRIKASDFFYKLFLF